MENNHPETTLKDVCFFLSNISDALNAVCDLLDSLVTRVCRLDEVDEPRIRTAFNVHFDHNRGEVNNDPSEFIPGQAMSVSELAARLRTGQLPMIAKDPQYSDEEDIDEDLTFEDPAFDLTDVSDRLSSIATTETSEHRQSYDGDGAAAPQKPQAPIDVDNSSAGSSEVGPS